MVMQARPSDLGAVVKSWKAEFPRLRYVYAWHALHAYWNGVSPTEPATKAYNSVIMQPQPTAGTMEVDPSMAWSAAVLNGVGTVADPVPLHNDMHAYLQGRKVAPDPCIFLFFIFFEPLIFYSLYISYC